MSVILSNFITGFNLEHMSKDNTIVENLRRVVCVHLCQFSRVLKCDENIFIVLNKDHSMRRARARSSHDALHVQY